MQNTLRMLPLFGIEIGIGVVGFVLSLLWMKRRAPEDTDAGTRSFLTKMWGGIVLFLFVLNYFL
jgi:hypothetical protein